MKPVKKMLPLALMAFLAVFSTAANWTAIQETVTEGLATLDIILDWAPDAIGKLMVILIYLAIVAFIVGFMAMILGLVDLKTVTGMFRKR